MTHLTNYHSEENIKKWLKLGNHQKKLQSVFFELQNNYAWLVLVIFLECWFWAETPMRSEPAYDSFCAILTQ